MRKYTTMTASRERYEDELEPPPAHYHANEYDVARVQSGSMDDVKYLMKPLANGEVLAVCRGKELFLAAGYVSQLLKNNSEAHFA